MGVQKLTRSGLNGVCEGLLKDKFASLLRLIKVLYL